ncbi:MAG: 30S ribosome-binding factor RbfA [Eubacteriales bacterium]|nr:30S ribosome-binding factor RbfA [Eubacteriales bacterium]MDD3571328.1 30S ribosome-binding factor RbfA [Eubacteriales bacterium]MDD4133921.1 30S ribosome-binding factor RbfA [Eubacteriales bacterium]NLO14334.1 30S ribosome-binding factor RbfA [Clostridiales bacterium]
MPQYRIDRISDEVKRALDRIIREEVRDPRVSGTFSITRVETTRDLRFAKVFISVLENEKRDDLIKALKGAAGFLRHALGQALSLRYTPQLQFIADQNIEYGIHISGILRQVLGEQGDNNNSEA